MMSNQRDARVSRRNRQESPIQKLQRYLQDTETQDVLNSLPAPDSVVFQKIRSNGHDSVHLLLGNRPNADGSPCQAWARIVSAETEDLQPPVLFYDQKPSADGSRNPQYPRSASSLLRKAAELHTPYRFLQHDPVDEATKVREMLSAIILYQAAVTGADASAWQWSRFKESLVQALRYINSHNAYHQWRHEQKIVALRHSISNKTTESYIEKDPEEQTMRAQSNDPAAEVPRTASSVDNDNYPGGTVRSWGSTIAIRPDTSLAKLKEQLGDSKFRMIDNIPPRPMTVSRHNFGGSFFPFRVLIGNAEYANIRESFEIYAYLNHGRINGASMKFLSHDSKGREQPYTVIQLLDVSLFEPFKYLNNLKKQSYKNNAATSARTAKLRSLISYYFFLAENQGLIGDPGVTINEEFGKRLCAVCKELQGQDFGDSDSNDGPENENGRNVDSNLNIHGHSPAKYANESEEDDRKLARGGGSDDQPSRIVKLKTQPVVLGEIIGSGPLEHGGQPPGRETAHDQDENFKNRLPRKEAIAQDDPTLELELRPSSQVAQEGSPPLTDDRADLMDDHDASVQYCEVEAPMGLHVRREQAPSNMTATSLDAGEGRSAIMLPLTNMIAVDGAAKARPDSAHAEVNMITRGSRSTVSFENPAPGTEIMQDIRAKNQAIQDPQPTDYLNNSSDKSIVMDIPSPALALSPLGASSVLLNTSRANSVISHAPLHGSVGSLLAAQVGGNKPLTPEDSAERDLKGQKISPSTSDAIHKALEVVHVISDDDDDESSALPHARIMTDPTPEAGIQPRKDFVDLTQLSSSPKGKKRKSGRFHLSDSEDDIIAETDGSEWRRKSRSRRK